MTKRRLANRTLVMSGGSRGIGLAILRTAAREGANVAFLAKTDTPHPRLEGTVRTAVAEIEAEGGGRALGIVGDVRNEADIERLVSAAVGEFGGVDICVNNASVLNLSATEDLPLSRFDLMQNVNIRGTFALTRACLPHLRRSDSGHVLSLSPPLNLSQRWLGAHPAYTLSKYGMSIVTLGIAAEAANQSLSVNCLWPKTTVATAAVVNILGGQEAAARSRSPQVMADAALEILSTPAGKVTGQTLIDEDVLRETGVGDFTGYGGGTEPDLDIFVDS
ncbi:MULTISPECIES: SDR family oxidoreductase [Nocardia]|uniref:SDR family oxidoreductase n=1 Tax=Nocardia abscessus TaxID=120957 RepID=UPI001893A85F|nr:NAD(P)-dependent oxidoreductase [Nocardia abscessus]MBF6472587.1 NAD(P)-dependent oxidoreductase [Nocardia abscessus]